MSSAKPDVLFDGLDQATRARRELLRPDEARELEQALAASALVRTSHEVGRSFDAEAAVRAGDDTLIARAALGALAAAPMPRRRAHLLRTLGAAAALLIATAAAASVAVVAHVRGTEVAQRLPAAPTHPRVVAQGHAPVRPRGAAAHDETAPAAAEPSAGRPVTAPVPTARPQSPSPTAAPTAQHPSGLASSPAREATGELTAADLFHDASAARRAADLPRARALYAELQARFPHTSEARVSLVSLGTLLLAAGRAGEAEAAFDSYLRGGRGDLTEEALVGRASALSTLGRRADEHRTWTELLERYPNSVYGARGKARLEALDAAAHASDGTR